MYAHEVLCPTGGPENPRDASVCLYAPVSARLRLARQREQ